MLFDLALKILFLAFTAGGFYAGYKQLRKSVNGIGTKLRKIVLYLAETAPDDKRERLTDLMKD